jgi:hypothetical protein
MKKTLLPQLQEPEARTAVAEALTALFERWQLHEVNQAQLLGLTSVLQLKQKIIQADSQTMERAGHLLGLDRALNKRYSMDPERGDRWIFTPNDYLNGFTPLSIMLENGLLGIASIRTVAESGH